MKKRKKSELVALIGSYSVIALGIGAVISVYGENSPMEREIGDFVRNVYVSNLLFYGTFISLGSAIVGQSIEAWREYRNDNF